MVEGPALPRPGDTIDGKYLIERVIGRGGMSVVFGAHHCVTQKRFAIKWQLPVNGSTFGTAPSEEATARFIREAQVAGRFQHPNVAAVYDVGAIEGAHYMVMDWLDGESLEERLERVQTLPLEEALRILLPCMRCVEEAHAKGIIHRDLKPGNIFLCRATKHEPEIAKVLDFGIAKFTGGELDAAVGHITQIGALLGTPYYLSPEQVTSRPIDKRIDVYAFGVILYQVLSGRVPFSASSLGELLIQISAGSHTRLRSTAPELPIGVEVIIARAMARDPDQRYQELGELIGALTTLETATPVENDNVSRAPLQSSETPASQYKPTLPITGATATPQPVSELPVDLPTPQQRSWWRVVLGAVVLTLLGVGGYFVWRLLPARDEAAEAVVPVVAPRAPAAAGGAAAIPHVRDVASTISEAGQHSRVREPETGVSAAARDAASPVLRAQQSRVESPSPVDAHGRTSSPPVRRVVKPRPVDPPPTAAPVGQPGSTAVPVKSQRNPLRMRLQ